MSDYFNYQLHTAVSYWDRRTFLRYSRQLYERDHRWTPPDSRQIRILLNPAKQPHLARLQPVFHYFDGLRRKQQQSLTATPALASFETPLVANMLLHDPRRDDRTAYLAHLHCANSKAAFLAYQDSIIEDLVNRGIRRLFGPVSLLPHLGSGALTSHWQLPPPQHTPYNPPYLPEVLARRMQPIAETILYTFDIPPNSASVPASPVKLRPLDSAQLGGNLLPLLAALCQNPVGFSPPDALEAQFWQQWLGPQLHGWVAWIEEQPVGLVLLLPDLAARLRRYRGGRGLWWLGLTAVRHRPVPTGRVLLGGVLPAWRGQGIGRQLWRQTIQSAQAAGWQKLTIGPVWKEGTAVPFLHHHRAIPQQTYQLYERTI
ncbi:GNAT family N-acetyltransferase [Candidatus Leptofilum sp.]|uniref:GNAT family N-acetyltransferase n=1 Tax=Candidatus Leptofilum sp. TaxID=3241576 RepID=UPI003B5A0EE5